MNTDKLLWLEHNKHEIDNARGWDVIGDVHSCYSELMTLLHNLGYVICNCGHKTTLNRRIVFVGDLTDRGPMPVETLKLVYELCEQGLAVLVRGNHEDILLNGVSQYPDVSSWNPSSNPEWHRTTIEKLQIAGQWFVDKYVTDFLPICPTKFEVKDLIVTHAAYSVDGTDTEFMWGSPSGWSADTAWKQGIPEGKLVVTGHCPVKEPKAVVNKQGGKSINIDTGAVYGNKLTSYQYPDNKIVAVPSLKEYYKSRRSSVFYE